MEAACLLVTAPTRGALTALAPAPASKHAVNWGEEAGPRPQDRCCLWSGFARHSAPEASARADCVPWGHPSTRGLFSLQGVSQRLSDAEVGLAPHAVTQTHP